MPAPTSPPNLRIAILAYEGCMATEIFGLADVLLISGHVTRALRRSPAKSGHASTPVAAPAAPAPFEVQVIALGKRSVRVAGGIAVAAQRLTGPVDLLVVPGLEIGRREDWGGKLALLSRELAFIRKTFASGTPVASVCVGAFLLGEAGLLAGRQVTTAWLFGEELARRYPTVRLCADAVLVEDGAITTTGAVSATFDLAMHLVKRHLGAGVAAGTARIALLPAQQRASQAPYVDRAMLPPSRPSFSQAVQQWLTDRLADTYDLERLALAFHVSARTLLRRVKAETGQSPLALLQQARVEQAKALLAATPWSLARITEAVGYADVATFSRLFARQVGESPAAYRRR